MKRQRNRSKVGFYLGVVGACWLGMLVLNMPAHSWAESIKIGCINPLQNRNGLEVKKWMELLAKLENQSGGLKLNGKNYDIEVVTYDDEFKVHKARSAAESLVNIDKVKYIVCQWFAPSILATMKVTEPNKVLLISDGMTNEPCMPEYKYCFRGYGVFFFQGYRAVTAEHWKEQGFKTVVTFAPDDEGGHVGTDQITKVYKSIGVEVIDNLFFRPGMTDLSPVATKIKQLNPSFIDTDATLGKEGPLLIQALHSAGWRGKIFMANLDQNMVDNIARRTGTEYLEGAIAVMRDAKQFHKDPKMRELIAAYEKEYGEWQAEGCTWMSNWFHLISAMKETQSVDVEVLANYLSSNPKPVMSLMGWSQQFARPDIGNCRTTDNATELWTGTVRNGKLVPYRKTSVKDQYLYSINAFGLQDVYKKYWDNYGYPKFAGE